MIVHQINETFAFESDHLEAHLKRVDGKTIDRYESEIWIERRASRVEAFLPDFFVMAPVAANAKIPVVSEAFEVVCWIIWSGQPILSKWADMKIIDQRLPNEYKDFQDAFLHYPVSELKGVNLKDVSGNSNVFLVKYSHAVTREDTG